MTKHKEMFEQWATECEKSAEWWDNQSKHVLDDLRAMYKRYPMAEMPDKIESIQAWQSDHSAADLRAEAARWRKLAELEGDS